MNGNGTGVDEEVKKYPMMNVKNKKDKNKTITNARNNKTNKRLRISPTDDCISSLEFIAHAMDSEDQFIWFKFVAQVANM
jgi:hypothetical protein